MFNTAESSGTLKKKAGCGCEACGGGGQIKKDSVKRGVNTDFMASAKKPQARAKVSKVMSEFKSGDLRSSSGDKVTNPKQAVAIAISESKRLKKK